MGKRQFKAWVHWAVSWGLYNAGDKYYLAVTKHR